MIAVLCAALVGIVLIVSSFGAKGDGAAQTESETLAEYKEELEAELELACSSVRGVGRCEVIITFARGTENGFR